MELSGLMAYQTTWEDKGIYWKYTDTVTPEDIFNSNHEFYQDSRSDNVDYQIVDFTNIQEIGFNDQTMKQIASLDSVESKSISNIKLALISDSDDVKKMFQEYIEHSDIFNSNWPTKIFNDIDSAREWLSEST